MKPTISLLVPTRRRPVSLRRMAESALATADHPERIEFALAIAEDDETREDAIREFADLKCGLAIAHPKAGTNKFELWNKAAEVARGRYFGIAADDLVFKTQGWDTKALAAIRPFKDRMAVAWGLDGSPFNGAIVNTAFFHRRWYEVLGRIYPGQFRHDWGDVWLTEIVQAVGRGVFMPDVLIEHLANVWGKAETDRTFAETAVFTADEPKLYVSLAAERRADITKVRDAMVEPGSHYVPSISACMIVKNEEASLAELLPLLIQQVDEIVIVDTGSTDKSVEVAEQYGATVLHHAWNDSFAEARNVALRAATGDWILSIDADERLLCNGRSLRNMLMEAHPVKEIDGLLMTLTNVMPDGANDRVEMFRLFRNRHDIAWEFRVHENLYCEDRRNLAVGHQPWVMLVHQGYNPEFTDQTAKKERNMRLVNMMRAEQPEEPFHLYSLGRELRFRGDEEERVQAVDVLEQAIQMWEAKTPRVRGVIWVRGYVPGMYSMAANAANLIGEYQRAIDITANIPPEVVTPEYSYCVGAAWAEQAKKTKDKSLLPKAVEWLTRAWQDEDIRMQSWERDLGSVGWKPYKMLSAVYGTLGDWVSAHEFAVRAILAKPDDQQTLALLAGTMDHVFPRAKKEPKKVA